VAVILTLTDTSLMAVLFHLMTHRQLHPCRQRPPWRLQMGKEALDILPSRPDCLEAIPLDLTPSTSPQWLLLPLRRLPACLFCSSNLDLETLILTL
jgi:hypothetical protein